MNEPRWDSIPSEPSPLYPWDEASTYIRLPTFFQNLSAEAALSKTNNDAKVLLKLGDSHHNGPYFTCSSFPADGPAGTWLVERGVEKGDFNSFGSRRGNHEIMMRELLPTFEFVINSHLARKVATLSTIQPVR